MRFMTILIMLLASFAVSFKAQAAESAWFEHEFVKMRLISASETAGESGDLSLGLEMQLKEGWKTYWRAPGDAGIPTQFDFDGSRNIVSYRTHWPVPEVFWQNGMRSIGYDTEVVLPLRLQTGDHTAPATMAAWSPIAASAAVQKSRAQRVAATGSNLLGEVLHGEADWVGGGLAEAADRGVGHDLGEVLQEVLVPGLGLHQLHRLGAACAAGGALAAAFVLKKP